MVTLRPFLSVYDHKVSVSVVIMRRGEEMEFSALDGLRLAQDEVEVGHDAGPWLAEQLSAAPHPKCSRRATFLDFWGTAVVRARDDHRRARQGRFQMVLAIRIGGKCSPCALRAAERHFSASTAGNGRRPITTRRAASGELQDLGDNNTPVRFSRGESGSSPTADTPNPEIKERKAESAVRLRRSKTPQYREHHGVFVALRSFSKEYPS